MVQPFSEAHCLHKLSRNGNLHGQGKTQLRLELKDTAIEAE